MKIGWLVKWSLGDGFDYTGKIIRKGPDFVAVQIITVNGVTPMYSHTVIFTLRANGVYIKRYARKSPVLQEA